MNNIEIKVRECITKARKSKDTIRLGNLGIILGEFQRGKTKNISEMESVRVLRRLEKLELDNIFISRSSIEGVLSSNNKVPVIGLDEQTSEFLDTVREFLPTQVAEDDLITWVKNNIDFSKLKNKFKAVGITMKSFPQGSVDGGVLKNIILNKF